MRTWASCKPQTSLARTHWSATIRGRKIAAHEGAFMSLFTRQSGGQRVLPSQNSEDTHQQSVSNLVVLAHVIGSRDYCHAPLGVSSFSFSVQNVWEMTTVVYKIACRSCTVCLPVIVFRLSIADTISSATVYSQCVEALRKRQKHGKFYCHDFGTAARPNKNRLARLILRQLAKMMFPRFTAQQDPHSY